MIKWLLIFLVTKLNFSRPDPVWREKINLNFDFHTSLWCFKRFYEGLKVLDKTFWGTTKDCEKHKLIFILIYLSEMHGTESVKLSWIDWNYFK